MVSICTTSKSEAVRLPRLCRSLLSQRGSLSSEMYMDEPLSAMIRPYCLSAVRITWFTAEYVEMSKGDFKRMRIPIGAALALVEFAAQCVAGRTNAALLDCSVNRSA